MGDDRRETADGRQPMGDNNRWEMTDVRQQMGDDRRKTAYGRQQMVDNNRRENSDGRQKRETTNGR